MLRDQSCRTAGCCVWAAPAGFGLSQKQSSGLGNLSASVAGCWASRGQRHGGSGVSPRPRYCIALRYMGPQRDELLPGGVGRGLGGVARMERG